MTREKRITAADIVVLVASLWTIAQAIWGPMLLPQGSQDRGAGSTYILSLIAGSAGLLGVGLAQMRRATVGRIFVATAGLIILIAPFTYASLPPLPLTFAIVSGLALLAAAKFIGPVPPPHSQR
jgi:hypothetical protein